MCYVVIINNQLFLPRIYRTGEQQCFKLLFTLSYTFNFRIFQIKTKIYDCYVYVLVFLQKKLEMNGDFTFSKSKYCSYVIIDEAFSDAHAEQ